MAEIQSLTFSQNQSLSLSRSVSASYERNESVASLQASVGQRAVVPQPEGFGGIFDVIDVSDDARQHTLGLRFELRLKSRIDPAPDKTIGWPECYRY